MLVETDQHAPACLRGGPIAEPARRVVNAADRLGSGRWASLLRTSSVVYLWGGMERAFAAGVEPVGAIQRLLDDVADLFEVAARTGFGRLGSERPERTGSEPDADVTPQSPAKLAAVTGDHYGRLFREFSSNAFWDEPVRLLRVRLERNGVVPAAWAGKSVLDAGCGGGRYSTAWRLLGAGTVVGLDISPIGIANADERARQAGINGVKFEVGDVLNIPFGDATFDIVFSNGVLHHTVDWQRGIAELLRVLKPGGWGWLYLIENPGGLFWDIVEVLRVIMKDEQRETARATLQTLQIPANRIFYMLDHVMVPINIRLTPEEIARCLASAGATAIRRLTRGTDFDRIEAIHRRDCYARVMYGVGENRFVFSRS